MQTSSPCLRSGSTAAAKGLKKMESTPLGDPVQGRAEQVDMLSMELHTRLAAIKGSAATVLGSSIPMHPEQIHHFFQIVDEQADQIYHLINSLVTVSQTELGPLPVDAGSVDLAEVIAAASADFQGAGQNGAITARIPPDMPAVRVDQLRMSQIMGILLTSAYQHSTGETSIRVAACVEGADVKVSVAFAERGASPGDERPPLTEFAHAFLPGRVKETWESDPTLLMCREIIISHGGRMWVESEESRDLASFVFTLPALLKEPAADPFVALHSPESSALADGLDSPVLLVADDPQMMQYVQEKLAEAQATFVHTSAPADLERLINSVEPHLILMDLPAAREGDFRLVKQAPTLSPAPVICLSWDSGSQSINEMLEAGAVDCLFVPFSSDELTARIRAALRKQGIPGGEETLRPYQLNELTVNYQDRRAYLAGQAVPLTATEYRLLFELSTKPGRILTHEYLLNQIWGDASSPDLRLLRAFVKSLRRKLCDNPKSPTYIFTEARVGYRMASSARTGQES